MRPQKLRDARDHIDFNQIASLQHQGAVNCVRWSPCGNMLASAGAGREGPLSVSHCTQVTKGSRRAEVLVWDSETQRQIASLGAKQAPSLAYSLGFRRDPGSPSVFLSVSLSLPVSLFSLFDSSLLLSFSLSHSPLLSRALHFSPLALSFSDISCTSFHPLTHSHFLPPPPFTTSLPSLSRVGRLLNNYVCRGNGHRQSWSHECAR